jgi:hypothetical protein
MKKKDKLALVRPEKLREKIYDIVYSGLDCPVLYDKLIKILEDHGTYLDHRLEKTNKKWKRGEFV